VGKEQPRTRMKGSQQKYNNTNMYIFMFWAYFGARVTEKTEKGCLKIILGIERVCLSLQI
jgi:hypothetical protein